MITIKADPFKVKLVAAFMAVYVVWGSTYLAIKLAIDTIPPFFMASSRFLLAGLVLYAVMRFQGQKAPSRRHWVEAAIIGSLLLGIGNGGVLIATRSIPTGVLSLLVAMVPVYIVLIEKRKHSLRNKKLVAGLTLGTLGIVSLVGPHAFSGANSGSLFGIAAALVSSFAWSYGSVYSRRAAVPESMMLFTAMQMICGGAVLGVVSLVMGEHTSFRLSEMSAVSVAAVAYLVVFGSIVGYSAYSFLLKHVEASKVSTYAYVNPIVAVLLGWAVAGEAITGQTLIAGAIILAAVWLMSGSKPKPQPVECKVEP